MPNLRMTSYEEVLDLVRENLANDSRFRYYCGLKSDERYLDVSILIEDKILGEVVDIHVGKALGEPIPYQGRPFTMGKNEERGTFLVGYLDVLVENAKLAYCARLENK